jgi:signal-transduction protein with cAMP-binding, CBS, and nucleotidyltransferase domain
MTIIERLFHLQKKSPFQSLNLGELQTLASVAKIQNFSEKEIIFQENATANRVLLPIQGNYRINNQEKSSIVGLNEVFSEKPFSNQIIAGPSGMTALAFSKNHLFTAFFECPDIIIDFLSGADLET